MPEIVDGEANLTPIAGMLDKSLDVVVIPLEGAGGFVLLAPVEELVENLDDGRAFGLGFLRL